MRWPGNQIKTNRENAPKKINNPQNVPGEHNNKYLDKNSSVGFYLKQKAINLNKPNLIKTCLMNSKYTSGYFIALTGWFIAF